MKRVLVVITARPSYSRIYTALTALRARKDVELQIVAAASAVVTRFGRVVDQIRADGFTVAEEIGSVVEGDTLANSAISTGLLTQQLAHSIERLKPDVVVTIADRHETLATAIAASYQHVPLCHIQGGEVTGSIDGKVRGAVTQLADVHCVSTKQAAHNVFMIRGGDDECYFQPDPIAAHNIHMTGCPSIDLAAQVAAEPEVPLTSGILVLQHPVTTEVDEAGDQMLATIRALKSFPHVHYFWPGEDAAASAMAKEMRMAELQPTRNLPPREFLRLLRLAECVVGNSSVGIRECAYLGVPAVNIGTRQQGRERAANVVDVPHEADVIRSEVARLRGQRFPQSTLYGDGRAGERIAGILAGESIEAVA